MPEGDTVWLACRRLDDALAGRVLTHSDFRVPQLATADLTGQTVTAVVSRGKHQLIRLDSGYTLHTHFEMDGSWHLYQRGSTWSGGPEWQVRVVLANDRWDAVGYRLPVVELLSTADEAQVVGHLGPDLLGPDWSPVEALRRLLADPSREIGQALLDQRNLAGIGNLYKSETLFLSGVTPWTKVGAVGDLGAIVTRAQRLLEANKGHWQQSTTGNLRRGEQHWVFERAGRPCRRCGERVRVARQGDPPQDRLSYWCPRCQSGPAPADRPQPRQGPG
ncbi:MAG TPA: DNA-formamidopyrimidine glycosylase family protein [Mycobacteriales bacterium]|nr:DNA-formamidopyrimidine glycosylase family protein [Mycobacteriales bacterium]